MHLAETEKENIREQCNDDQFNDDQLISIYLCMHVCTDITYLTTFWSNVMKKDISADLYRKCFTLCSRILPNVLHNTTLRVLSCVSGNFWFTQVEALNIFKNNIMQLYWVFMRFHLALTCTSDLFIANLLYSWYVYLVIYRFIPALTYLILFSVIFPYFASLLRPFYILLPTNFLKTHTTQFQTA